MGTENCHQRRKARAFAVAAGLGGLLAIRCVLPAGTPQIRTGRKTAAGTSIAALEKVRIGGSYQWILERSQDVTSPVVLFLPGASAHLPNSEERNLFNTVMMTKVLPVASRQGG